MEMEGEETPTRVYAYYLRSILFFFFGIYFSRRMPPFPSLGGRLGITYVRRKVPFSSS